MEDLKFGDVRKITINGSKEYIVVYLGKRRGNPLFANLFGEVTEVRPSYHKITDVAGVRLKPEVREAFNNTSKAYKKLLEIGQEIERLNVAERKAESEFYDSVDKLGKAQGIYSVKQFMRELTKKLALDENKAYAVGYFVGTPIEVVMNDRISFSRHVETRANPGQYGFYSRMYDGNTEIIEECDSYRQFMEKMKPRDYIFRNLKDTKDYKIVEHKHIADWDKGFCYLHQVVIELKNKYLTDEILDRLVKSLR